MPNNWKTYKLGDIASVQTGPFGSQLHQKDYVMDGTPILTVEHLGNNRIVHQNLPRVNDYDKDRLKKYCIQKGDIVFSRVGSVDRRAFVTEKEDGWLFSGRCLRVRADEKNVNGSFLSYYFGQESFKDLIRRIAVGATMPSLNTSILSSIEISIPENLQEQQSIASILSAIDDKIENNLAINKTLEEMAMALYKHWFVDFGPFKDGEFVECEIFGINNLISIPKDFKILYIKEEIKRLKSTSKYIQDNVLKVGKTRVFDQSSNRILGYHNNQPDFKADFENPLLIFGDHTCRMELICENFSVGPNLIPFKTDTKEYTYLVYLTLKDKVRMNDYKRHWSELMLHQFIVPNDISIINDFNNSVKEFFNLINKNEIENQTLTQLRDTFLPKLISGEVRLKEFRDN